MVRKTLGPGARLLGTMLVAAAMASTAQASLIPGKPVVVQANNTLVTVEFLMADFDHAGNLYFLGSGNRGHVVDPAPNSDATGLGQFLFNNETNMPGDTVQLIGVFNAGDKLHFAFDVLDPPAPNDDLFESQQKGQRKQFAFNSQHNVYGIEDGKRNAPGAD